MATESIFKTVEIKTKKECKAFIRALEKAKRISLKEEEIIVPYKELTAEEIKEFFSN